MVFWVLVVVLVLGFVLGMPSGLHLETTWVLTYFLKETSAWKMDLHGMLLAS